MSFKEIGAVELKDNAFKMIGQDWMLITAKKEDKVNTMTASWGGLGVMWGKNVAYAVIRPQRYTKEFVDNSQEFSLSFLGEEYRKVLTYLGTVSGRDEDKISKSELTVVEDNNIPYFKEANTVLFCKNLFAQEIKPECLNNSEVDYKWYPEKDYHTLYIAEITKVMVKV